MDERLLRVEIESARPQAVQSVRVVPVRVDEEIGGTRFDATYRVFDKGCYRLLVTYNNVHVQHSPFLCKIC